MTGMTRDDWDDQGEKASWLTGVTEMPGMTGMTKDDWG